MNQQQISMAEVFAVIGELYLQLKTAQRQLALLKEPTNAANSEDGRPNLRSVPEEDDDGRSD